jgi:hypothetical protein
MSTTNRPLKPTIANVTRILNNAGVSPLGMQRAGLVAQLGHTNEIVAVHYNRPMGARHATDTDLTAWFTTAAEALATRSLALTRVGPHVATVKAAS